MHRVLCRMCTSAKYSLNPCLSFSERHVRCFRTGRHRVSLHVPDAPYSTSNMPTFSALISDMWDAQTRGQALTLYTLAPFAGPCLSPVVSGFMQVSGVYWRWVFWVSTFFTAFCSAIILFTIPETFKYVHVICQHILHRVLISQYRPLILARRAKKLRKETGNDRYYAPIEKNRPSFKQIAVSVLTRPVLIFVREPMLIALSLYMSVSHVVLSHQRVY